MVVKYRENPTERSNANMNKTPGVGLKILFFLSLEFLGTSGLHDTWSGLTDDVQGSFVHSSHLTCSGNALTPLVIKDRAKCLTGKGVNGINSLLGWWFEFIPFRIGEGARWSLKVLLSFLSPNPWSSDRFPLLLPRAYCSSGLDPFKKKDLSFVRHILLAVFCSVSWWQRINEK